MSEFTLTPVVNDHCPTCPLSSSSKVRQHVTTEVHGPRTGILFIAEAPGRNEDQDGRPVIGLSGRILRRVVLQLNGGTENGIAYGNLVRCRPVQMSDGMYSDKDRPPTREEVTCCRNNILADIQRLKPKMIVLCGKTAVTGLALDPVTKEPLDPNTSITSVRGTQYVVRTPDGTEYPAIATYHFAYVARNPVSGAVFKEDIARAFLRARGKVQDFSKRGKPVTVLDTVPKVKELLRHLVKGLTKNDIVAMDYETVSNNRIGNRLLTIGFAYNTEEAFVIPYKHPQSPWTGAEFKEIRDLLIKFFSTRHVSFSSLVCHNLKFEAAITLDEFGVYLRAFNLEDTMLRAHGLNENRKAALRLAFGLKPLSDEWLSFTGYGDDDIKSVLELVTQGRSEEVPLAALAEYNGIDCYVTCRLYIMQDAMADLDGYKERLKLLGIHMHGPVSVYAAQMERNGVRADTEQLRFLMTDASPILKRQREIERTLYARETTKMANKMLLGDNKRTAGMVGIWGSKKSDPWLFHINKQASKEALYLKVLNLKAGQTAKGKASIDKTFYEKNKGVVEVDLLAEWTELDKLRGTYIEGIYKLIQTHKDMRDGRVRAQFTFHNTATSRTASEQPNMQNIPKGKTSSAKAIKSLYIVDPMHVMVCADYSQAEVRWLAEVTQDPNLIRAFKNVERVQAEYARNPTKENEIRLAQEGDFHRQTAAQLLGKQPHEVTDMERGAAKAIVFGLIYGMSAFGLSNRLGISRQEAEAYQNKFLNQFPKAREWLERIEAEGFAAGYVESPIGRRRHLVSNYILGRESPYMGDSGDGQRRMVSDVGQYKFYEDRVCRNAPIQSIASDTNLMACIRIQNYILDHNKKWRLINIVHDSIIAEVPFDEVEEYIAVANRIMSDPDIFKAFGIRLDVPFRADFTVGPNWGVQYDVDVVESCNLVCSDCKKKRKVKRPVRNRRCEDCGSTNVEIALSKGPIKTVLGYMRKTYGYKTAAAAVN